MIYIFLVNKWLKQKPNYEEGKQAIKQLNRQHTYDQNIYVCVCVLVLVILIIVCLWRRCVVEEVHLFVCLVLFFLSYLSSTPSSFPCPPLSSSAATANAAAAAVACDAIAAATTTATVAATAATTTAAATAHRVLRRPSMRPQPQPQRPPDYC